MLRRLRTLRSRVFPKFRYPSKGEKKVLSIYVEVQVGGECQRRVARALFDPGCGKNLMSRGMASKLNIHYPDRFGKPILNTIGMDEFRSLGQIEGRWSCNNARFEPRFYDAVWEVSDTHVIYDIIIGNDTITENRFLKWSEELG